MAARSPLRLPEQERRGGTHTICEGGFRCIRAHPQPEGEPAECHLQGAWLPLCRRKRRRRFRRSERPSSRQEEPCRWCKAPRRERAKSASPQHSTQSVVVVTSPASGLKMHMRSNSLPKKKDVGAAQFFLSERQRGRAAV